MAINYGFFDAAVDEATGKYDREYYSADMAKVFNAIAGNGVVKNNKGGLKVVENSNTLSVNVSTGFAFVEGRYIENTTSYTLPISAGGSKKRIDIVVIRASWVESVRDVHFEVKEGEESDNPVAPSLTRSENTYELQLCKITVPANATGITDDMIEDTRANEQVCGFVSGLGGSDSAGFVDCTINPDAGEEFASDWLLDINGNVVSPEQKRMYRITTSGEYYNTLFSYDLSSNTYYGIASFELEMSEAEGHNLWNNSATVKLQFTPAQSGKLQYTGREMSPSWLFYDETQLQIGGTISATEVGTYYATFQPISGYTWANGTTDVISVAWSIQKRTITIPTLIENVFEYTGNANVLAFNGLESNWVNITDNAKVVVGSYTCVLSLKDETNTEWEDGTIGTKTYTWMIDGKTNVFDYSPKAVEFDSLTSSVEVTIITNSNGEIIAESNGTNIVTVSSVVDKKFTATVGDSEYVGNTTITITIRSDGLVNPVIINLPVRKKTGIAIVSWSDGTDEEIMAMVEAWHKGDIDLRQVWNVGDVRKVRLGSPVYKGLLGIGYSGVVEAKWVNANDNSPLFVNTTSNNGIFGHGIDNTAQEIELVLLNKGGDQYYEVDEAGHTECAFLVGMKDCLSKVCMPNIYNENIARIGFNISIGYGTSGVCFYQSVLNKYSKQTEVQSVIRGYDNYFSSSSVNFTKDMKVDNMKYLQGCLIEVQEHYSPILPTSVLEAMLTPLFGRENEAISTIYKNGNIYDNESDVYYDKKYITSSTNGTSTDIYSFALAYTNTMAKRLPKSFRKVFTPFKSVNMLVNGGNSIGHYPYCRLPYSSEVTGNKINYTEGGEKLLEYYQNENNRKKMVNGEYMPYLLMNYSDAIETSTMFLIDVSTMLQPASSQNGKVSFTEDGYNQYVIYGGISPTSSNIYIVGTNDKLTKAYVIEGNFTMLVSDSNGYDEYGLYMIDKDGKLEEAGIVRPDSKTYGAIIPDLKNYYYQSGTADSSSMGSRVTQREDMLYFGKRNSNFDKLAESIELVATSSPLTSGIKQYNIKNNSVEMFLPESLRNTKYDKSGFGLSFVFQI